MKIRRIDQQDVLNHAKNFEKKCHRATASDLRFHELPIFNISERASVDMRMMKEKLLNRKERKKDYMTKNDESAKIMAIYDKIKFLYTKLATLYSTNENKLTSLLVKHIKVEYYLFSK